MAYDTTGKRIRTENLAGQATTTEWNCCHKVSETRPDGSVTTWDYDDEDRMGEPTTEYAYDDQFIRTATTRTVDNLFSAGAVVMTAVPFDGPFGELACGAAAGCGVGTKKAWRASVGAVIHEIVSEWC